MSVIVPFSQPTTFRQPPPEAQPTYLAIAAAQMHADSRLFAPDQEPASITIDKPLDITSQAQKADMQKTARDWPEGTSPEVHGTYDKLLRSGTITKDQYNKAMHDPRQFQEDQ